MSKSWSRLGTPVDTRRHRTRARKKAPAVGSGHDMVASSALVFSCHRGSIVDCRLRAWTFRGTPRWGLGMALARVPLSHGSWVKLGVFRHGAMEEFEYARTVFLIGTLVLLVWVITTKRLARKYWRSVPASPCTRLCWPKPSVSQGRRLCKRTLPGLRCRMWTITRRSRGGWSHRSPNRSTSLVVRPWRRYSRVSTRNT